MKGAESGCDPLAMDGGGVAGGQAIEAPVAGGESGSVAAVNERPTEIGVSLQGRIPARRRLTPGR